MVEFWYLVTAALLVVSGGGKLADPSPTRGALAAAGLPSGRWTAPALGLGEIAAGTAAIVVGGTIPAVAVAAAYLGFAGFVGVALVRHLPLETCGCFGRSDTPPGFLHLGVNLTAAAAAMAVAGGGGTSVWEALEGQPAGGVPYLAFIAIGTYLLTLLLSELPRVLHRTAA